MAFEYASQFRRYGRNGVIVVTWQEFGLPFCEPLFGLLSVALGASPIAAAVKNPERFSTVVTLVQPSAEFFGTAGGDIRQGSLKRRQHQVTILRLILSAEAPHHVRQLDFPLRSFLLRIRRTDAWLNPGGASFPGRDRRWFGGGFSGGPRGVVH